MNNNSLLKPKPLRLGDTIGVFTPSSPGYVWNEGLFTNGLKNLERLGFKVKLGAVTAARQNQGYRSAAPKDRADEFMALIHDDAVHGLISTIGGSNSSSLIQHLDFQAIRNARKVICGFSDVTSLHMAILAKAKLTTVYGPSIMCWFGDWPDGCLQSNEWFLDAVMQHKIGKRSIKQPTVWSNHKRRWDNGEWKDIPREWSANAGWRSLNAGVVEAPLLALNFNTLGSAAGTDYWPDFKGNILLLEDMDAPMARTERALHQLKYNGVFDQIAGLIIGKPEFFDGQGAPFSYDQLFLDIIGPRPYPIVSNFDCGHTLPMLSIPQLCRVRLESTKSPGGPDEVQFEFLESGFLESKFLE